MCPATQEQMKSIRLEIINSVLLPAMGGACGCGGFGWIRAAYLNMSDPTQTYPPAWEPIATPRRSYARPSKVEVLRHEVVVLHHVVVALHHEVVHGTSP